MKYAFSLLPNVDGELGLALLSFLTHYPLSGLFPRCCHNSPSPIVVVVAIFVAIVVHVSYTRALVAINSLC